MRALRRDLPALTRRDTEETTPPPPAEGRQLSHSPGLKVTLQHLGSQSPYKPAAWELQQHIWPVEMAGNRDTWLRNQELVLCSAHHGTGQRRVSHSHLPDLQGDKKSNTTSPGERNLNPLQLPTVFTIQFSFLTNLCLIWEQGGCPKPSVSRDLLKYISHTVCLRSFSASFLLL